MKYRCVRYILFDLIIGWALISAGVILGLLSSIFYLIFTVPLLVWYGITTFKWIKVFLTVKFSKPKKVVTKGFHCAYRDRCGILLFANSCYSVLTFNDSGLKGKYIFLGDMFGSNNEVTVTYYPSCKYIQSIDLFIERDS